MKTTKNGLAGFLKNLGAIAVIGLMVASCGKENKSGNSGSGGAIPPTVGTYPSTMNGNQLPANWLDIVAQENPCAGSQQGYQVGNPGAGINQRQQSQLAVNGNVNVNAGAIYLGVTSYGDIALVQNQNGQAIMNTYTCPRGGAAGQVQLVQNKVVALNLSNECEVDEITAANVMVTVQGVGMELAFRKINIPGAQSSICRGQIYY